MINQSDSESPKKKVNAWTKKAESSSLMDKMVKISSEIRKDDGDADQMIGKDQLDSLFFGRLPDNVKTDQENALIKE